MHHPPATVRFEIQVVDLLPSNSRPKSTITPPTATTSSEHPRLPSQGVKKLSRASRHVTFDIGATNIHLIEQVKDMTAEEVEAKWYGENELTQIKSQNKLAANFMRVGLKQPELRGHCFRGLEYMHSVVRNQRRNVMAKSLDIVLKEQHRQRAENDLDADLLASVYEHHSVQCIESGLQFGRIDGDAATSVYEGKPSYYEPEFPGNDDSVGCNRRDYDYYSVDVLIDDDEISELSDCELLSLDSDFSRRSFVHQLKGLLRRKLM